MPKPFEQSLGFERIVEYANEYLPKKSFFAAWMEDIICSLTGKPSPYDYVARVCRAKEFADEIHPEHRQASRLLLEQVIVNLAPELGSLSNISGEGGGNPFSCSTIAPLDDSVIRADKGEAIVGLRYQVLSGAFYKYINISLRMIDQDMKEDPALKESDFKQQFEFSQKTIADAAIPLIEKRRELFADFPDDQIASVARETIILEPDMKLVEDAQVIARKDEILAEIETIERALTIELKAVIQKARKEVRRIQAIEERHVAKLLPLKGIFDACAHYLSEEMRKEMKESLKQFTDDAASHFAIETVLPRDVCNDLREGYGMYCNGFIKE